MKAILSEQLISLLPLGSSCDVMVKRSTARAGRRRKYTFVAQLRRSLYKKKRKRQIASRLLGNRGLFISKEANKGGNLMRELRGPGQSDTLRCGLAYKSLISGSCSFFCEREKCKCHLVSPSISTCKKLSTRSTKSRSLLKFAISEHKTGSIKTQSFVAVLSHKIRVHAFYTPPAL